MTYYVDLSPYEYTETEDALINVGWLSAGYEFPVGDVSDEFLCKLIICADSLENVMRGVRDCHFCDEESPIRISAPVSRGWVSLGMGEIHVVGAEDETYSAPSLIVHYVESHRYRPPASFIEAVMNCPGPGGVEVLGRAMG